MTPHIAAWGKLQIDNTLGAIGTNAAAIGLDKLAQNGVLYKGLEVLGGGAILAGLVLGAATGAVVGSAVDANAQAEARQTQQQINQSAAEGRARADSYRRAIGACLQGRGYTVT